MAKYHLEWQTNGSLTFECDDKISQHGIEKDIQRCLDGLAADTPDDLCDDIGARLISSSEGFGDYGIVKLT